MKFIIFLLIFQSIYSILNTQTMQSKIKNINSPLYKDSEFIPSNFNYITVKSTNNEEAIILKYTQTMTLKQLEQELQANQRRKQESSIKKRLIKQNGDKIDYNQSIEQYMMKSAIRELDEDSFFFGEEPLSIISNNHSNHLIQKEVLHKNQIIRDERIEKYGVCCIMNNNRSQVFQVYFRSMPNLSIKMKILNQLNNLYNTNLQLKDIQIKGINMKVQSLHDESCQFTYQTFKISNLEQLVLKSQSLVYVQIKTLGNEFTYSNVLDATIENVDMNMIHQRNLIKIINFDNSFVLLDYDKIKKFEVKYLLGILNIPNASSKGLKIFNKVLLPNQQIYNIGFVFNIFKCINYLQALIVNQFQTFQFELTQNPQLSSTELNKMVVEDNFFSRLGSRQNGATTKAYSLTPLLIYNSEFKLEINNSPQLFYELIKKFIKNYYTHYSNYLENSIISRFVHSLYKQVYNLQQFQGIAYRKVFYQLQCKKEDTLEFKNFIMCSKNEHLAFAVDRQSKKTTYIAIQSYSGRLVSKNSIFADLQQIIFLPYTTFKVTRVEDKGKGETWIQLEQIAIPIKKNEQNIIVWLDHQEKQITDYSIIERLKNANKSILLRQFSNNVAYKQWTISNKNYLKDKFFKKVVITNMRRLQNKVTNDFAGVQTINYTKGLWPEAHVIAFIGHVEGTKTSLRQKNIDPQSILVTANTSQLLLNLMMIMELTQQFKKYQQSLLKNKQIAASKMQMQGPGKSAQVVQQLTEKKKKFEKIEKQHYMDFFSKIQIEQETPAEDNQHLIKSIIQSHYGKANEINQEIKLISINQSLIKKPMQSIDQSHKFATPSLMKSPSDKEQYKSSINPANISKIGIKKYPNQEEEDNNLVLLHSELQSKITAKKGLSTIESEYHSKIKANYDNMNNKFNSPQMSGLPKPSMKKDKSVIMLSDEEQEYK